MVINFLCLYLHLTIAKKIKAHPKSSFFGIYLYIKNIKSKYYKYFVGVCLNCL